MVSLWTSLQFNGKTSEWNDESNGSSIESKRRQRPTMLQPCNQDQSWICCMQAQMIVMSYMVQLWTSFQCIRITFCSVAFIIAMFSIKLLDLSKPTLNDNLHLQYVIKMSVFISNEYILSSSFNTVTASEILVICDLLQMQCC